MPIYVCSESALQHYRRALYPAEKDSSVRVGSLKDAVSLRKGVDLLSLAGLGLPSPSAEEPLHVLVPPSSARGRSKGIVSTVWGDVLPREAFRKVNSDAYVSSPEFVFLQMARKLELIPLIELGMELCGTYRRNAEGGLTTYDQPTLTTPRRIEQFLDAVGSAYGVSRARNALKYVAANSASPLETIVYLLLCLPRRLGGYAFPQPELNAAIKLSRRGRQHTLRRSSVPDLYWRVAKIDLECHGKMHELKERRAEDSMRRKALERMEVEVVELTYEEVRNQKLFRATVRRLAKKLGVRLRAQSENGFAEHEKALRSYLFPEHVQLGQLWDEEGFESEESISWEREELPSEFDSWEVYMGDGDVPEL